MSNKIKAAIIGPGNIGTDLLMKAMRSDVIEPVWMVGVDADSPGLARAQELGLKTTAEGPDLKIGRVVPKNQHHPSDLTGPDVPSEPEAFLRTHRDPGGPFVWLPALNCPVFGC